MVRSIGAAVAVAAASLSSVATLPAQTADGEGAIFLLLPIGARAVATGGAVAAAGQGSESVWWNPATTARLARREVAVHHSQTFAATSTALAVVVPWRRLGTFTLAANLVDLGSQEVTPPEGGPPTGTVLPRNIVAAVSYASAVGGRLDLGVTYKLVQVRFDCSGQCAAVPVLAATTSAADAGVRLDLAGWLPISVGMAVRNIGPSLELDGQRAPLPTRWQAGVLYVVPGLERYTDDVAVRVSADMLGAGSDFTPREFGPGVRVGAEATWQRRVTLRGGYVFEERGGRNSEAAGPTVGLGLTAGRLVVDIAREFQGLSVDAGQPPTYVALRYHF